MKESPQRKKTYSRLQCDNDFELESDLVEPKRIHSEEKTYSCLQCDNDYELESDLVEQEESIQRKNHTTVHSVMKILTLKATC